MIHSFKVLELFFDLNLRATNPISFKLRARIHMIFADCFFGALSPMVAAKSYLLLGASHQYACTLWPRREKA